MNILFVLISKVELKQNLSLEVLGVVLIQVGSAVCRVHTEGFQVPGWDIHVVWRERKIKQWF